MNYSPATNENIPFISQIYDENIESLHGIHRSCDTWKQLLSDQKSAYFVVYTEEPAAWFRVDFEEDALWLGMLQVKPAHQRRGIGRYILSVVEAMAAERGCRKVGIHTTQDNAPARALYVSAGYLVTEIGPCTTADGVDRVGYTFQKEL